MPTIPQALLEQFNTRFGGCPDTIWQAPGRINLIGDHTDYQGGLALPIAVPYGTWIAAKMRSDGDINVYSDYRNTATQLSVDLIPQAVVNRPLSGLMGFIVAVWHLLGINNGADISIMSTLPVASGLSSSAALSLGLLAAMTDMQGTNLSTRHLVSQARRIENNYLGVDSGILDPLAIALGKADFALVVDALAQDGYHVPFDYAGEGQSLWIIDTLTPRRLAASGYDQRVTETRSASERLGISCLREATVDQVNQIADPVLRMRAQHVVWENRRVTWTVEAAARHDFERVKQLFWESHWSLSENFEVSTPLLDQTVTWLQAMGIGARLTGAGFGGSLIALADNGQDQEISQLLIKRYTENGWTLPRLLEVPRPAQGLHKLK